MQCGPIRGPYGDAGPILGRFGLSGPVWAVLRRSEPVWAGSGPVWRSGPVQLSEPIPAEFDSAQNRRVTPNWVGR